MYDYHEVICSLYEVHVVLSHIWLNMIVKEVSIMLNYLLLTMAVLMRPERVHHNR